MLYILPSAPKKIWLSESEKAGVNNLLRRGLGGYDCPVGLPRNYENELNRNHSIHSMFSATGLIFTVFK